MARISKNTKDMFQLEDREHGTGALGIPPSLRAKIQRGYDGRHECVFINDVPTNRRQVLKLIVWLQRAAGEID